MTVEYRAPVHRPRRRGRLAPVTGVAAVCALLSSLGRPGLIVPAIAAAVAVVHLIRKEA